MFSKPKQNKRRNIKRPPQKAAQRPVRRRRLSESARKISVAKKVITYGFMPMAGISLYVMSNFAPADFFSLPEVKSTSSIKIGAIQEKDSFTTVQKAAVVEPKKEVPTIHAQKKLYAKDLVERKTQFAYDKGIRSGFYKSSKLGLPQDIIAATETVKISPIAMQAALHRETSQGTNPAAKGNPFQIDRSTLFEYVSGNSYFDYDSKETYVDRFDDFYGNTNPDLVKQMRMISSYVHRNYKVKNGDSDNTFVFNDAQFKRDGNKYPVVNGKKIKSLKGWALALRGDGFFGAAATCVKWKKAESNLINRFLSEGLVEPVRYMAECEGFLYRLIHLRGENGAYTAIANRENSVAKAFPRASQRKFLNIGKFKTGAQALDHLKKEFDSDCQALAAEVGLMKLQIKAERSDKLAKRSSAPSLGYGSS